MDLDFDGFGSSTDSIYLSSSWTSGMLVTGIDALTYLNDEDEDDQNDQYPEITDTSLFSVNVLSLFYDCYVTPDELFEDFCCDAYAGWSTIEEQNLYALVSQDSI